MSTKHKKLGEILLETGEITESQLEQALKVSKEKGTVLGSTLLDLGFIEEKTLYKGLGYLFHIPYIELSDTDVEKSASSLISEKLARKHVMIPIKKDGKYLTVVMSDPLNFYAIDDAKSITGLEITPAISSPKDIFNAIDKYYGSENAVMAFEELQKEYSNLGFTGLSELTESQVASAPVVKLINSILRHAIKSNASDIHIEPTNTNLRIRFRIDGELQEVMTSSMAAHPAMTTRIKIMGQMDIAEKRVPQDGRVETLVDGVQVDLRISLLPTVYGEKIVIRILGGSSGALDISQLGISKPNRRLFEKITKSPNGIVLVSGPTGSGKTTTLYSLLKQANRPEVNIITVEDPVEYKLVGINQVQVNVKAGLTFANGLRSILRQDPDIIMIGEIRDGETAEIAIRASITGHLVFSTIHTNDSASSVARLVDMGIEPYLVSSSLVGVVAQRLVRNICQKCKVEYTPDSAEMQILNLSETKPIYRGAGCPSCNGTGYKGRSGIHEILVVTKEIRELVNKGASIDDIAKLGVSQGTITLRQSCIDLVLNGTTTMDELVKVTYSVDN
ncbi:MAG: ATPase, T2SS/T4P/T4SS family [Eubacteriales bacterium]